MVKKRLGERTERASVPRSRKNKVDTPFKACTNASDAEKRTLEGAEASIGAAIYLTYTLAARCCQGHGQQALIRFYEAVLRWAGQMHLDGVDIKEFLDRVRNPDGGLTYADACATKPPGNA